MVRIIQLFINQRKEEPFKLCRNELGIFIGMPLSCKISCFLQTHYRIEGNHQGKSKSYPSLLIIQLAWCCVLLKQTKLALQVDDQACGLFSHIAKQTITKFQSHFQIQTVYKVTNQIKHLKDSPYMLKINIPIKY